MKIIVENGEHFSDKIEIYIEEFNPHLKVRDKLKQICKQEGEWNRNYLRLIHNNMIMNGDEYIGRYKLCDSDIIYYGTIENYLKGDGDVIVEVFMVGLTWDWIWLVANADNDTISTLRSRINEFGSDIICHIWDCSGNEMRDDQLVRDIDLNGGYYRLVVSCGEAKQISSFDKCCNYHDQYRLQSMRFGRHPDQQYIRTIMTVRDRLSSNEVIDPIFDSNLSDFPPAFVSCKYLFCDYICSRIWDSFCEYSNAKGYSKEILLCSILVVLNEYLEAKRVDPVNDSKSIKMIMINALDHLIDLKHERDFSDYFSSEIFNYPFLLRPRSVSKIGKLSRKRLLYFEKCLIINGQFQFMRFPFRSSLTVGEVKKIIANRFGIETQDVNCMNKQNDIQPKDEDLYNRKCDPTFDVMLNMGRFDFIQDLGVGGYGTAKLYMDKMTNKQVVIKMQNDHDFNLYRDIFISSMKGELGNLVKYLGTVRDEDQIHLVMEYLSGGSLTSRIKQRKFMQEQDIVKFAYHILTQIVELHRLGIAHRDIKPDNIVFDEVGNAKIIDFGLSRYTGKLSMTERLVTMKTIELGDWCYLAPEVIEEMPYTNKIDIWSFGIILVQMVTGVPPSVEEIMKTHKSDLIYKFCPVVKISHEFHEFINSCLFVDPDKRPTGLKLLDTLFNIIYSKGSLTQYIQQGKCQPEQEVIRIAYQILAQINELHKSQIVHDHIKPDNILFDREENVKLFDPILLGFLFVFDESIMNPMPSSKPNPYMSPDFVGISQSVLASDIWSFGMVLVEMVTGKPPFHWIESDQIIGELRNLSKYEFKPIFPISESMKQFISACLTVDPDERPTSGNLLGMELMRKYLVDH